MHGRRPLFLSACLVCTLVGTLAGTRLGEAHAVSCAENEIWSYELVEISGPDTDTDDVWGPGVNLETPDGERLIVWDRDENGFGGSTVFTGELER